MDSELDIRICWPKDRARARLFSTAPRIPPVTTASVSFGSAAPVHGPLLPGRFQTLPVSDGRHARSRSGVSGVVGCCLLRSPGQPPRFEPVLNVEPGLSGLSCVVRKTCFNRSLRGVALGRSNVTTIRWSECPENSGELDLAAPDWRILGCQDPMEPN